MRFNRGVAAVVLVCAAVFCGQPALAASRPVGVKSLAGVPLRKVWLPGTNATQEVCRLGMAGTPVGSVGDETNGGTIFFGENDTYWTYMEMRPDSCPACSFPGGNIGTLSAAHLALYFPFAPETVTVTISVVGSVPVPCHFPNYQDPNGIICDEFSTTLNCQDPQTTVDFAIPFANPCQLAAPAGFFAKAFLGFNFVIASDTTALNKPQIAVQATARVCNSFNPVGFISYDFVSEYQVGNPVMYAEVLQCEDVPVRRYTWGRLKQLYR